MPTPKKNEKKTDFIARCVSDEEAKKTFPDNSQRVAFCYKQWEDRDKEQ